MADTNKNLKATCSFYASKWHMVTMLLPNIVKKINEGAKITTILEKSLTNEMEVLLGKLNLKNKAEILGIGWDRVNINDIEKNIENKDYIIISGSKDFINQTRKQVEEKIKSNKTITIIDCYDINECQGEITEILSNYSKILNTSGEKDKAEYVRNIKMAN